MFALIVLLACSQSPEPAPPPPAPRPAPPPAGPAPFALPSGPGAITPSLATDGDDLLYVWQEPDGEAGRVRFARWHAGAWSPPVDIAKGKEILANWADYPSVGVGTGGELVAHWFRETKDAYTFDMARSKDGGATWAPLAAPYPAGLHGERGFLSYAAEPEGLRAFWLDGRASVEGHHGHGGVTALHSARLGADGFSPEEVVDPRTCDCCGTDAVVSAGHATVVYRDRSETESRDISAASPRGVTPVGADGWEIHGCPVNGPAADARGDDVVTAWFTGADDGQSVRAAFSTDGGATFGTARTVAGAAADARPIGRVDVALEPDGTALVVWLSAEGADGRVRMRRVAPDGRVGPALDLGASATARGAGFPRLAYSPPPPVSGGRAGEGGRLVVAWTKPEGGNTGVTLDPRAVPAVDQALPTSTATAVATLPAFHATELGGAPVTDATVRGKPLLLNVWATWCGPCREELPALEIVRKKHPNVQVYALSVDGADAADAVRTMRDARAPGLPVLYPDTNLAAGLGVASLPRTFLYDASGVLVWSSAGAISADDPGLTKALASVEQ